MIGALPGFIAFDFPVTSNSLLRVAQLHFPYTYFVVANFLYMTAIR